MTKKRGLTPIEFIVKGLLLGLIITGMSVIVIVIGNVYNRANLKTPPDQSMRVYIRTLYPDARDIAVLCAEDTDGHGYIGCTATYTDRDGRRSDPIAAECAGNRLASTGTSGCVPPTIR